VYQLERKEIMCEKSIVGAMGEPWNRNARRSRGGMKRKAIKEGEF